MVGQDRGAVDDAAEEADGAVDHAVLEVAEAAQLEGAQLAVVGGEEGVERLGEDVDDAGEVLAAPVQVVHGGVDGARVVEVGDAARVQQLGKEDAVVEGDGHAAAGEGVAHVHGVAEEDHAVGRLARGREPAVGHASRNLAVLERLLGGRADGLREGGEDVVADIAPDTAVGD